MERLGVERVEIAVRGPRPNVFPLPLISQHPIPIILPFPSFPIRRSLRILHPSPPLASPSQAFTSTKPQPTPPVARYTAPAVIGTSRPHAARTALHRLECSVHSLSRPQHTEPTQNTQTGEESPFWQHSTEHKTKQLKQQLWRRL